jgi:hypothetical protein
MSATTALVGALTALVVAITAAAKLGQQLHHERRERLERRRRLRG